MACDVVEIAFNDWFDNTLTESVGPDSFVNMLYLFPAVYNGMNQEMIEITLYKLHCYKSYSIHNCNFLTGLLEITLIRVVESRLD